MLLSGTARAHLARWRDAAYAAVGPVRRVSVRYYHRACMSRIAGASFGVSRNDRVARVQSHSDGTIFATWPGDRRISWQEGSIVSQQAPGVGSAAPEFALMSGDRERWSLRGVLRRQSAVLVFYLWDFSGT